ncbi:Retrovirus-related pol Polyprotein [Phytophthora palmivora]|uniref:Retrovirus-related pol Polyprotein n=1 Tax=Phytophthora palmivora TaxID=4796 RepID=A0A2P4XG24_9STRA|nr:Retrovirus-related pol Polyprotein [Phytophthora palmivora]
MGIPEGLQELLSLLDTEGEGDVVCLLLQSLYGLKQASRDLGRARFILGIEIDYDMERKALTISQRAYTESIVNRFGQENAKPSLTPLDPSVHRTKADEPQSDDDKAKMKSKPYRSLRHWDAGIKVVRYLLKTKDVAITYDGRMGTELTAYSDADWAGNRDDRRSVSGVMLMMCGAPVLWRSTFQKAVALSFTEAEYMALSDCIKEVVWMRRLLKDIGAEQHGPTGLSTKTLRFLLMPSNVGPKLETSN